MNLLPLVIVAIITVFLLGILTGPDVSRTPEGGQKSEIVESLEHIVGSVLASGTSVLLEWTGKVVGLSTAIPAIEFMLGLLLVFVVVAVFDELIFVPMMKKRS